MKKINVWRDLQSRENIRLSLPQTEIVKTEVETTNNEDAESKERDGQADYAIAPTVEKKAKTGRSPQRNV